MKNSDAKEPTDENDRTGLAKAGETPVFVDEIFVKWFGIDYLVAPAAAVKKWVELKRDKILRYAKKGYFNLPQTVARKKIIDDLRLSGLSQDKANDFASDIENYYSEFRTFMRLQLLQNKTTEQILKDLDAQGGN